MRAVAMGWGMLGDTNSLEFASVLACHCAGTCEVIAAVQDRAHVERFLHRRGLWSECDDIVAIRGPPDQLDDPDDELGAQWDGVEDLEPLSWAA